mmetsp:Transcript_9257/g.17313  ORF Transcript_9257/g.17313 Transcript_9257/m.17313 type:complete len:260 (-) Transcript_9257:1585-2364(-)
MWVSSSAAASASASALALASAASFSFSLRSCFLVSFFAGAASSSSSEGGGREALPPSSSSDPPPPMSASCLACFALSFANLFSFRDMPAVAPPPSPAPSAAAGGGGGRERSVPGRAPLFQRPRHRRADRPGVPPDHAPLPQEHVPVRLLGRVERPATAERAVPAPRAPDTDRPADRRPPHPAPRPQSHPSGPERRGHLPQVPAAVPGVSRPDRRRGGGVVHEHAPRDDARQDINPGPHRARHRGIERFAEGRPGSEKIE